MARIKNFSTFAWFKAADASVTADETDSVLTLKQGTLSGVDLTATITGTGAEGALVPVNLSDPSDGKTYVWTGSSVQVAANSDSLVKTGSAQITFTITAGAANVNAAKALNGLTYDVKVASSAGEQVRFANQNSTIASTGAVGTYSATTAITIGTITFGLDGEENPTISYSSKKDSAAKSDGCYFYYSVSPKQNAAEESYDAETSYGTVNISFSVHTAG